MASEEPIVIDLGSGFTKIGLAGGDEPLESLESLLHFSREGIKNVPFHIGDVCVGVTPNGGSSCYKSVSIFEEGRVVNWEAFERFFYSLINNDIRSRERDEVCLVGSPSLQHQRPQMGGIIFEKHQITRLQVMWKNKWCCC